MQNPIMNAVFSSLMINAGIKTLIGISSTSLYHLVYVSEFLLRLVSSRGRNIYVLWLKGMIVGAIRPEYTRHFL